MQREMNRRRFLEVSGAAAGVAAVGPAPRLDAQQDPRKEPSGNMKLGVVTYNIAKDWDLPTLIEKCTELKIEGVELRTTHAHGVEPTLTPDERNEVRARFEDSPVTLWGLGSTCEYHSPDAAEVQKQIDVTREFCELARDVGAAGVKVRPNGIPDEVPVEKTLEQIGKSLIKCGEIAADCGVEIWMEVHGHKSQHPPHCRAIMDHCQHPSVGVCWNSNPGEAVDGTVAPYFELLKDYIKSCHITELADDAYPWKELFGLLKGIGYDRFTLAEIQDNPQPERFMQYYRALWLEYTS